MGGGEVNVAYDGTFGDLSAAADANLFDFNDDFGMDFYPAETAPVATAFTAVNGATVSPRDVFNNSDSIPPSTSFTDLTTPASTYLETPDDDYQTSPLFTDSAGVDKHAGAKDWYSLFPDAIDNATPAPMARVSSSASTNQVVVHAGGEMHQRKRSSTHTSPSFSPALRHSNVAGVAPRKRDKPLPPILVDEGDTVAMKRARNTAAARKSRAKKVEERDDFLARIADLEGQIAYWKNKALGQATDEDDDE